MNTATRFGRMDVALRAQSRPTRATSLKRSTRRGRGVRIVDVGIAGMNMRERTRPTCSERGLAARGRGGRAPDARIPRWRDGRGWRLASENERAGTTACSASRPWWWAAVSQAQFKTRHPGAGLSRPRAPGRSGRRLAAQSSPGRRRAPSSPASSRFFFGLRLAALHLHRVTRSFLPMGGASPQGGR
jgi:hypothetical protein